MDKPLKIVQRWARTISTRNVDKMTNFYSEKAILLATFDPFLQEKKR